MQFLIEIDEEWLETLEALINKVLEQSRATPEEAIEHTIFAQISQQLDTNKKPLLELRTHNRGNKILTDNSNIATRLKTVKEESHVS